VRARALACAAVALAFAGPATGAALAQAPGAASADALPAWEAFKRENESIKDYTETLTAHEIKDGRVEDRVYHFWFAKPALVRSEIVSGPGSGSAAVWHGGDTVRGHKGGFLAGIKLTLSVNDPRATDIRGKTIGAAFFPVMIASFENGGKLSEAPGQPVDGAATDDVTLTPADPAKERNLTREVIVLSRATHLPVEHLGYEGAQVVEDEHFTDQKINVGIPPGQFDM
jgi:outer membrane lipoprotein-sorting protein